MIASTMTTPVVCAFRAVSVYFGSMRWMTTGALASPPTRSGPSSAFGSGGGGGGGGGGRGRWWGRRGGARRQEGVHRLLVGIALVRRRRAHEDDEGDDAEVDAQRGERAFPPAVAFLLAAFDELALQVHDVELFAM